MTAAGGLGFAAAHWVIHWIFRHRAGDRPDAAMPRVAGFTEDLFFVVGIAHLADSSPATFFDPANFTGRQFDLRHVAIAAHQRGG